MINILHLKKNYYINKDNFTTALNNVSININDGELLSIIGASGSGKTTLLHIIAGLIPYDSGQVFIDKQDIGKLSQSQRTELRNHKISLILQNFGLIEDFSVFDNVQLPVCFSKNTKNCKKRVYDVLEQVGLKEYIRKPVSQLSGGEKQRVAIARGLVTEPEYILADEPTGALDSKTSDEIMKLLLNLNKKGTTIIIVTHNPQIAKMCSRQIELKDGKIINDTQGGSTDESSH